MFLVLGLGNPGRRYERTRHNAGFLVLDRLAARTQTTLSDRQFKAEVGKGLLHGSPVILAKPQTFMNLSGEAAVSLRGYYKVTDDRIVVIHDDVDLPFGDVRVKKGGGHGGHNGLRDLHARLGGGHYIRVRFGVSRPPPEWDTADYVLGNWTTQESARLDEIVDVAADAVEAVVRLGVDTAMQRFNTRPKAAAGDAPSAGSS